MWYRQSSTPMKPSTAISWESPQENFRELTRSYALHKPVYWSRAQAWLLVVAVLKIWMTEDPMTTKTNKPRTIGPTGYWLFFFKVVSGTFPLLCTFFWNLALFLSASLLDVVISARISHTPIPHKPDSVPTTSFYVEESTPHSQWTNNNVR